MKTILIACFLVAFISCSGKNNAKIQAEHNAEAAINQEHETKSLSVSENFQIDMIYCSDADRVIFHDFLTHIKPFRSYQMPELMIETARFFLNKPYVASTLEFEPEGLVVNLREFDCTTFVETVLALSRMVKMSEQPSFEDFGKQLQNIRYKRGNIGNYTDRLHYFSDWIYENETRNHVEDITKELGGEPYRPNLNFMSTHPDSYKQIKSNPEYIEIMRKKEIEISERDVYSFIPKEKIVSYEKEMNDGDIISFVTDVEGLDVSHVGIFYRDKGQATFIHASTSAGKVIVNPQPLYDYMKNNRRNIGIMIVRPIS